VYAERLWLQEHGKLAEGEAVQPTKEEAAALLKTLDAQARMEKIRLDNWSEFCCADTSLVAVRRQTRMDLETLGNAYWEILRNVAGELALIVHVPGFTVRLLPLDPTPVPVEMRVKVSPISYQTIQITRCFRRYVQVVEGMPPVYFKELGDPRVVSRKTGKVFESVEALQREDEADQPATEILHFKVHSPRSAYGVPRWMGTLLEVLGSRQAAEVNFFYFQNKSVPPLALLVSGGRLSQSSVPRIERFIEEHVKGKKNFHKILIIEAESTRTASNERAGRISLEFHPLTSAQQTDALFQHYDERNIDKIGAAFRLPRLLRGDIRDFNRSCYSEDTETLTEHGWKRVDDIGEGERIAVYDQKRGCIEYAVPAAKLVYEVDEELLHFRNAHVDVLVTGNHRMLVRPCNTKRPSWKICRADEIQYSRFQFRVAAEPDTWKSEAPESITLPRCCQIQRGHNHTPIAMSDWLEFLGYFVSEGGLVLTDHPAAPYLVYIDQKKPAPLDKMRACLDRIGWKYSVQVKPCGTTHLLLSNRCLRKWLAENCGSYSQSRRIPPEYLRLSKEQISILFNALMLGDGSIDPRDGRACGYYSTTSPILAGQVQQICLQLGLRAHVSPHGDGYRVNIADYRTSQLRRSTDVRRVPYQGRVYCFSVPSHGLFVTRRNGKPVIHGNTALAALHFAEEQIFQPERQEFDFLINRKILADMGIRFWRFCSNAPVTRDPQVMAETVKNLVTANVLTPEEGRRLAGDVFNIEFRAIRAPWVKQPIPLTLAGFPVESDKQTEMLHSSVPSQMTTPAARPDGPGAPAPSTAVIEDVGADAHERFLRLKPEQMERDVIYVPDEELASWLEPEPAPPDSQEDADA
jgi:PBSX family phage portal protein